LWESPGWPASSRNNGRRMLAAELNPPHHLGTSPKTVITLEGLPWPFSRPKAGGNECMTRLF